MIPDGIVILDAGEPLRSARYVDELLARLPHAELPSADTLRRSAMLLRAASSRALAASRRAELLAAQRDPRPTVQEVTT